MVLGFSVLLHKSFIIRVAVAFMFVGAVISTLIAHLPVQAGLLSSLVWVGVFLFSMRTRAQQSWLSLSKNEGLQFQHFGHSSIALELQQIVVSPIFVAFSARNSIHHFGPKFKERLIVVWRDSVPPMDFRRIAIYAHWRASGISRIEQKIR